LLIGKKPWVKIRQWAEKCGTMVQFQVLGQRVLYVNDPKMLKRILLTNQRNYRKDIESSYKHFMCLLGKGLVTSEDEQWRKGRLLLTHALRIDILHDIPQIAFDAFHRLFKKVNIGGKAVNLEEEFRHLTLQVIGSAVLSLTPQEADDILPALYLPLVVECNRRVWEPYRSYLPFLAGCRERSRCLQKLNEFLFSFIKKRWELRQKEAATNTSRKQDILDLCMSQLTELPASMIYQLRDDVKTMLLAGHETSSAVLTWATFEVTKNPQLIDNLVKEHKSLFGDDSFNHPPAFDDVKKLHWAPAILREALRKYSVVPLVMRIAANDDVVPKQESGLGFDFTIPKGATIMAGIEGVHHRPDIWPSPETFVPQRFFDMDAVDPYAFIPFINGPRNCLGQHFSLMETQLILSYFFTYANIKLLQPEKSGEKHDFIIPVVPAIGLEAIVTSFSE